MIVSTVEQVKDFVDKTVALYHKGIVRDDFILGTEVLMNEKDGEVLATVGVKNEKVHVRYTHDYILLVLSEERW